MLLFLLLILRGKPTGPCPAQNLLFLLADGQGVDHDVRLLERRQLNDAIRPSFRVYAGPARGPAAPDAIQRSLGIISMILEGFR